MKIDEGRRIVLRYELFDREGELLESSEEGEPMEYEHGAGEIAPGLEGALEGKTVGEKVRVTLPPEEAFGRTDPKSSVRTPREPASTQPYPVAWLPGSIPRILGIVSVTSPEPYHPGHRS